MEIKTGRKQSEPDGPVVAVPPDRGRPARKAAALKSQHTTSLGARIRAVVRVLAGVSLIGLLVMAAFAAYRYAYVTDLLRLRAIEIDGCRHADPAKIEALVRRHFQGNLLRLELAELRARLEREPWIRRVEIRRILPETLKIEVEERVPSVIAEVGGELQLLDKEGILLDRYGPGYAKIDVPVFSGLKGDTPEAYQVFQEQNSTRVKLGVQVLDELSSGAPEMARTISEIDLSDESNVKALLIDDAAAVYLGDRDFLRRFEMFLSSLADYRNLKAEGGEVDAIDLRFDNRVVFILKSGEAERAASAAKGALGTERAGSEPAARRIRN